MGINNFKFNYKIKNPVFYYEIINIFVFIIITNC